MGSPPACCQQLSVLARAAAAAANASPLLFAPSPEKESALVDLQRQVKLLTQKETAFSKQQKALEAQVSGVMRCLGVWCKKGCLGRLLQLVVFSAVSHRSSATSRLQLARVRQLWQKSSRSRSWQRREPRPTRTGVRRASDCSNQAAWMPGAMPWR